MARLVILGTSFAVPDAHHENAHLVFIGDESLLLVDTGCNPTVRLEEAGLDFLDLTDILITHFHPDHVSGLPTLLMNSWLMGRKSTLNIYGLEETLQRIEKNMDLYSWKNWSDFYPLIQRLLPAEEKFLALENPDFLMNTSPVHHMIPNVAVRIESRRTGKTVVYSSDTEPCPELIRLAQGADILIHESSGASHGHTSAAQAGEIARLANVKSLFLIHYPSKEVNHYLLVEQAGQTFNGPIALTNDFMEIEF